MWHLSGRPRPRKWPKLQNLRARVCPAPWCRWRRHRARKTTRASECCHLLDSLWVDCIVHIFILLNTPCFPPTDPKRPTSSRRWPTIPSWAILTQTKRRRRRLCRTTRSASSAWTSTSCPAKSSAVSFTSSSPVSRRSETPTPRRLR